MPTTINVNAAGYDLDVGGVTGSIVSGTLFLGHASNLGGQLRAKAITDTPAIIAQAYSGTANAVEVWDSVGNVVAEISKTGAAVFDANLTVASALYVTAATARVGIGVAANSALMVGGDQIATFQTSGLWQNVTSIQSPSAGAGPLTLISANLRVGGDVAGGRLNVLGTADSLIPFSIQQGSGGTTQLVKISDSSSSEKISMYSTGVVVIGGGLTLVPAASATPATNGQLTFEATSNTSLTIKYKGSDGIVRSNILTLS